MEPNTLKRKRAKKDVSSEADADRRRGRPRVEKSDESAADRRRTQIRMAQRAYRERKEGNLEELRNRVSELSSTVNLMREAFATLKRQFCNASLTPVQAAQLEEAHSKIESLAGNTRNGESSTPDRKQSATLEKPVEPKASSSVSKVRNVPSWLDESALLSEMNKPQRSAQELALGWKFYSSGAQSVSDDLPQIYMTPRDAEWIREFQQSPRTATPALSSASAEVHEYRPFPLVQQLDLPQSFSSQESTFARRLQRTCIEKAYQLLLSPGTRPATYERVFRLSLLGRSRAKIIEAVKPQLAAGPHQDRNFWDSSLIHIGGAGTHYPPRDSFGNILPKKESRNVGVVEPQTLALLENAIRGELASDISVEVAGYEGEWFNSQDVQGYLEEKGIFIESSATHVEAETTIEQARISDGTLTASSTTTVSRTSNSPGILQNFGTEDFDVSQFDPLLEEQSFPDVGFSDAETGSFFNFLRPGETVKHHDVGNLDSQLTGWPPRNSWPDVLETSSVVSRISAGLQSRKRIVVDVQALIDSLAMTGICLGRSPGFRRHDVDRALAQASVPAG